MKLLESPTSPQILDQDYQCPGPLKNRGDFCLNNFTPKQAHTLPKKKKTRSIENFPFLRIFTTTNAKFQCVRVCVSRTSKEKGAPPEKYIKSIHKHSRSSEKLFHIFCCWYGPTLAFLETAIVFRWIHTSARFHREGHRPLVPLNTKRTSKPHPMPP